MPTAKKAEAVRGAHCFSPRDTSTPTWVLGQLSSTRKGGCYSTLSDVSVFANPIQECFANFQPLHAILYVVHFSTIFSPFLSLSLPCSHLSTRGFFIIFSGVFSAYIIATMIHNMPIERFEKVRIIFRINSRSRILRSGATLYTLQVASHRRLSQTWW